MAKSNWTTNDAALSGFLASAIALVSVSSFFAETEWLRISVIVLAVILMAVLSFFLLRNYRRRLNSENRPSGGKHARHR